LQISLIRLLQTAGQARVSAVYAEVESFINSLAILYSDLDSTVEFVVIHT